MPLRLVALPAADAHGWMEPAVHTYVTAMGYPQGTEHTRIPLWREHLGRPGWTAVGALRTATTSEMLRPAVRRLAVRAPWARDREILVGVTYGYTGAPDQWWNRQLRTGLHQIGATPAEIAAIADDYFELTELHVHPIAQGHGVGQALVTSLLAHRPESAVLCSTPEVAQEANRAWSLYRRLGFNDVVRNYTFAGDPRPFAFLGRSLPLT